MSAKSCSKCGGKYTCKCTSAPARTKVLEVYLVLPLPECVNEEATANAVEDMYNSLMESEEYAEIVRARSLKPTTLPAANYRFAITLERTDEPADEPAK